MLKSTLALLLFSASAFAAPQEIQIQPGSSIKLEPNEVTIVTCTGELLLNRFCDCKPTKTGEMALTLVTVSHGTVQEKELAQFTTEKDCRAGMKLTNICSI